MNISTGAIAAQGDAERENQAGDQKDRERKPAREEIHLAQKRCRELLDPGQQTADTTDFRMHSRCHHDAHALPRGHQSAGVGHRGAVAERRVLRNGIDGFVDRDRFAGQGRLLQPQALGADQADVRRNLVAGLQNDKVAGHQSVSRHRRSGPVPDHGRVGRQHLTDRLQGALRLTFLQKANGRIHDGNGKNHGSVDPVAEGGRQGRGAQKNVDQKIIEMRQETDEPAAAFGRRQAVGSVLREAHLGFAIRQSLRCDSEAYHRPVG